MRYLVILLTIFFFAACGSADSKSAGNEIKSGGPRQLTAIEWIEPEKKLGKIREGQKVSIAFRFRNSGNKPLVIESVEPTCGCTVADYPKQPISPGAEGEISGSFDSEGREGLQHKTIAVRANTEGSGEHQLSFEVDVQPKPATTEAPQQ